MDSTCGELAARLLSNPNLVRGAAEAASREEKLFRQLLEHRKLPEKGWEEPLVERFVRECARWDANNFAGNAGAGEREGRVVCGIVRRRHFGLSHGIGRSGEIAAVQPKAAGSSVIYKLAVALLRDLITRCLGMRSIKGILMVPMATGMSISLVLQTLRHSEHKRRGLKADQAGPKFVLWPRIDQKTCLKAIVTAGYVPVVIENIIDGDQVRTDLAAINAKIVELGADSILCVLSTTSCFAPRVPDDVESLARICKQAGIAHVINNAYGLQCNKCCHIIDQACRVGRVDAVVQSTDKNLMVPVGGAFIIGPDKDWIERELSKCYPGRASMAPILDVFLTLITLGKQGFERLRKQRISLTTAFRQRLEQLAAKHGERVLETSKRNTISFAISLTCATSDPEAATRFGSMLFTRGVSGARVVAPGTAKEVAGIEFSSYGASHSEYPCAYVTVACAIGIDEEEIDAMATRLDKTFASFGTQKDS